VFIENEAYDDRIYDEHFVMILVPFDIVQKFKKHYLSHIYGYLSLLILNKNLRHSRRRKIFVA